MYNFEFGGFTFGRKRFGAFTHIPFRPHLMMMLAPAPLPSPTTLLTLSWSRMVTRFRPMSCGSQNFSISKFAIQNFNFNLGCSSSHKGVLHQVYVSVDIINKLVAKVNFLFHCILWDTSHRILFYIYATVFVHHKNTLSTSFCFTRNFIVYKM